MAYTITSAPVRDRWSADAAWRSAAARPVPLLEDLRQQRTLGVDLNADHIACWVLDPAGDPLGEPATIPLDLSGLPASVRDGRLRAAFSGLVRLARQHGCASVTVENLDFADARHLGRETMSRGGRGGGSAGSSPDCPPAVPGYLLAGMAATAGLWVIAVDPPTPAPGAAATGQAPRDRKPDR